MRLKKNSIPYMMQGVVISNNDDDQMGRLKVWVPAVDGENYTVDSLPWAEYCSPLMGLTTDYKVGRELDFRQGPASYGFWAIPKVNAIVLIMFLQGDPNRRFYIGSVPVLHSNRGLPAGRNVNPDIDPPPTGPFTDTYDDFQPAYRNLRTAFGDLTSSEAQTRGSYERQAAQASTNKDGTEGYSQNTVDQGNLDSQVYCLSTPGGHFFTLVDDPKHCRMRMKTISGNQIILDDTNERIYISSARGGNWIEMDEDGHINVYGADDISFSTGGDFNITAEGSFNVNATGSINLVSADNINIDGAAQLNISIAGSIMQTACADMNLRAVGNIIGTGAQIHMNGPDATPAAAAENPSVVPTHEPFVRPTSKIVRNSFWKA